MKKIIPWGTLCFLMNLLVIQLHGQTQKVWFKGYIEDSISGEKLIGASVFNFNSEQGTISNQFGYFSLPVSSDSSVKILISYVGFQQKLIEITSTKDTLIRIKLKQNTELEEVVIIGEKNKTGIVSSDFGMLNLSTKTISKLPTLSGISDVLRASQLLPGIQSGKEGSSQLYIRGGNSDQNLILMDDIPVYYVNHIGGFLSVFDASAINSISIYKGGFPARYGGRLSGLLDIRVKEGSKSLKKETLTIGLLATEYKIEGPIKIDTSSFLLSIRRCNADIPTRLYALMFTEGFNQGGYTFYDLTAKYTQNMGPKDKLFLTSYFGRDKIFVSGTSVSSDGLFRDKSSISTRWGNFITSAKWTHIFSHSLFGNVTVAYSRFMYNRKLTSKTIQLDNYSLEGFYKLSFGSTIQDVICNLGFEKNIGSKHTLEFGLQNMFHVFNPYYNKLEISTSTTPVRDNKSRQLSPESRMYFEDRVELSKKWKVSAGAQLAFFYADTRAYLALEPRLATRYSLLENFHLNAGYSRMTQNLHLLSSSGLGLPTDLWIPVTASIPPGISDQVGLGIDWQLPNSIPVHLTVEAYYKKMKNLVEFREGTVFFQSGIDWQLSVETGGAGISKGIEFLIEKPTGKLNGWISYSLSKHDRTFLGLNEGQTFPFRYDRTHDISMVANFNISKTINICSTWVYWTGEAVTLAYGGYEVPTIINMSGLDYQVAHAYTSRNGYRLPDYHRLDIAIQFSKSFPKADRTISFGIYNVYNRMNPFFLFWDKGSDDTMRLLQVTIFPIMPNLSVTYDFKSRPSL